jgi:hypothetical protein
VDTALGEDGERPAPYLRIPRCRFESDQAHKLLRSGMIVEAKEELMDRGNLKFAIAIFAVVVVVLSVAYVIHRQPELRKNNVMLVDEIGKIVNQ